MHADRPLCIVPAYKYLGFWLHEHGTYEKGTNELSKSASRALGVLIAKFRSCGDMCWTLYTKLYNALVLPVLMYASGVWGINNHSKITIVQTRAIKYFLGAGKRASNIATQADIGWPSIKSVQTLETLRLWCRILNMNNSRIPHIIHTWSLRYRKSWDSRMILRAQELNIMNYISEQCNVKYVVEKAKEALLQEENKFFQQSLWNNRQNETHGNKLRLYRLLKSEITWQPEAYLNCKATRIERRVLSQLRCGNLPLEIETGRYSRPKIPVENRLCKLCNKQCVENEVHFLIGCDFYSDLRHKIIKTASEIQPRFNNYYETIKFQYLLQLPHLQLELVRTCNYMFRRRQRVKINI